ncbi:alternative ribosome-rescue factor A [Eikenella sp. NML120348]|uniref:alternative ribosome-rescue factor A n=1 Tax=Eikenella sp. NML120348 TaxID=1795831 RepID=UPI0007DE9D0D|nr:alternative ribosome-rescue factor A [Eikenella sp. NML120348]OAM39882.1 hypothetical protein A7P99_01350 [Eikenella sp. NML120348]
MAHQLNKGKIRDNALKALVRSNLFRHKTERNKKGKGSYNRQAAKKWRDGFEQPSRFICTMHNQSAAYSLDLKTALPIFR